ncbi:nuclear protein localization protein 4 homolog isoform X3 [Salvelinus namaycush]|uniref:Nuclear protein localization protein 4 homolog isoform X3 n=1 Tax=Salvelinus namaycush TaxID=8040 RepID=A0A8U0PUT1_SALNM|nr:nuclear protein localization protein 4 homolog isoform X3 [Salvelinus namaycush]
MAENIIIRVQSPNGMKKIPATKKETAAAFLNKVGKEFGFPSNGFTIFLNRNKTDEIQSQNKTLSLLKIKHGDMLYLYPSGSPGPAGETMDVATPHSSSLPSTSHSSSSSSSMMSRSHSAPHISEDEIDQYLAKQEGKIYRNKDPQLCRHGSMGKCVHCVPLEPFDEEYLSHLEPPVKHMSFHAYIRKLTGGADKGKFVALENISCKIKSGCEGHPPWPEGICTKCQPSAITLNRQKYRHIDNIMFENHTIADRFLDFWRKTGSQRMGYLYGRYTEHKDIPLAIRAEVAAIYEPPQIATQNSIELVEDPKAAAVEEIAAKLGLRKHWRGSILFHVQPFIWVVPTSLTGNRYRRTSGSSPPSLTGNRYRRTSGSSPRHSGGTGVGEHLGRTPQSLRGNRCRRTSGSYPSSLGEQVQENIWVVSPSLGEQVQENIWVVPHLTQGNRCRRTSGSYPTSLRGTGAGEHLGRTPPHSGATGAGEHLSQGHQTAKQQSPTRRLLPTWIPSHWPL